MFRLARLCAHPRRLSSAAKAPVASAAPASAAPKAASASALKWSAKYIHLAAYVSAKGSAKVPQKYRTSDGAHLGLWVTAQRGLKAQDKLADDRVHQLDLVNFIWKVQVDWDAFYALLQSFQEQHGHCAVPRLYVGEGLKLGAWVHRLRSSRRTLSKERLAKLEALQFEWTALEAWTELNLKRLETYHLRHSHSAVPQNLKGLGGWVKAQRVLKKTGKLPASTAARLDALDFDYKITPWHQHFDSFLAFKQVHGHGRVARTFVSADGFKLGEWVKTQRQSFRKGILSQDRLAKLEANGFVWKALDAFCQSVWDRRLGALEGYKKLKGDCYVPGGYVFDGYKLGSWVKAQRFLHSSGKLKADRRLRLEQVGLKWNVKEALFAEKVELFRDYVSTIGEVPHSFIHPDGTQLGKWVAAQRQAFIAKTLRTDRIEMLENAGLTWKPAKFWRLPTEPKQKRPAGGFRTLPADAKVHPKTGLH
jgi:hypothetical protein